VQLGGDAGAVGIGFGGGQALAPMELSMRADASVPIGGTCQAKCSQKAHHYFGTGVDPRFATCRAVNNLHCSGNTVNIT